MSNLKPCPFCGTSNEKHNNIVKLYDDEYYAYEYCNACGARVYANWNTRPIEDALQARIEELEELLKLVTPELNSTDAVSVVQEIFELRWKDRLEAMEIERNNWVDACSRAEARIAKLERKKEQLLEIDHQRVQYVRKLEKAAVKWYKYPDKKPIDGRHLFWDSDGNAPHVLPYNDIVVRNNPGVFSTQTHWAYLPAPPQEEE